MRSNEHRLTFAMALAAAFVLLSVSVCRAGGAGTIGDGLLSPARHERTWIQDEVAVRRALDGFPGWVRAGEPRVFTREGLYGHINGGADLVLEYGFRELTVHVFEPAGGGEREIVLELYRMESGEAAFGLYSTRLEGDEERWPGIALDHWFTRGQANLVKGRYLANILAYGCEDEEVGAFVAALERKIPGEGTARPAGMSLLPAEGKVRGSGRYIKGPLAARNESPFLEPAFRGPGADKVEAFSARYGAAPALSKIIVIDLGGTGKEAIAEKARPAAAPGGLAEEVLALFKEYLRDVRVEGDTVEGRNQAERWFLFRAEGRFAALVLGEPDEAVAGSRIAEALRPGKQP